MIHPRRRRAPALLAILLCAGLLALGGCDGGGFEIKIESPPSGDQPPDSGDPDSPDNGGTEPPSNNPFAGAWVASYGDDTASGQIQRGPNQYATLMTIQQSGASLSGSGRMFRVFREGDTAADEVSFNISGTASGNSAVIDLASSPAGAFSFTPRLYLRQAGSRMVGMHVELANNGSVARSGHAVWRRVVSGSVGGSWNAAYNDLFAGSNTEARSRSAVMELAESGGALSGSGGVVEFRREGNPLVLDFDVVRGERSDDHVGWTFGAEDLANHEVDWYGFFAGNRIAAAYGQFNAEGRLTRFGHTVWRRAPSPSPSAINHSWVTAFGDAEAASGIRKSDFIAVVTLQAGEGGEVTGSAQVYDQGADNPQFRNFNVRNGRITGSRVRFDLVGANTTFHWDLRLGSANMSGAYKYVNQNGDRFISRGAATWRQAASSPSLRGTWAAAYFDTHGFTSPETTQFTTVSISSQEDGQLSGTGALRFAGEDSRRLFNLQGDINGRNIEWVWSGSDLFGDTLWELRQSGSWLFGTYLNLDSGGNVEAQGSAAWVRAGSGTAAIE